MRDALSILGQLVQLLCTGVGGWTIGTWLGEKTREFFGQ